jgi:hypothetical protein
MGKPWVICGKMLEEAFDTTHMIVYRSELSGALDGKVGEAAPRERAGRLSEARSLVRDALLCAMGS